MVNAKKPKPRALTAMQLAFAKAFVGEAKGNAKRAAQLTGYSAVPSLKSKALRDEIKRLEAEQQQASLQDQVLEDPKIATITEVKQFLTEAMRGEVNEHHVTNRGMVVSTPTSPRDRVKAGELLGKHYKLFTEVVEQTNRIPRDQIDQLIQALDQVQDPTIQIQVNQNQSQVSQQLVDELAEPTDEASRSDLLAASTNPVVSPNSSNPPV